MSHACLIVSPLQESIHARGLEKAIAHEMEPFDETKADECFADGTRWDWYQIGGRFTGSLTGYDPYNDEANMETCKLCAGTGIRPNGLQQFGADWFEHCHGCNGCHGKGRRVANELKPYAGDILRISEFDVSKFTRAYAFLRNRHWHEAERMGWFGVSAYTECERKDMDKPVANPDQWVQKCLFKHPNGARVICWNEPHEIWKENFVKRFIAPLEAHETIIVVDYHV